MRAGRAGLPAWLLRIPLLNHEQNAVAGLTNRWLARLASQVLEGFRIASARARARTIGNPVRADIAALAAPQSDSRAVTIDRGCWCSAAVRARSA